MKYLRPFAMLTILVATSGFLLYSTYINVKNRAIEQLNTQQLMHAKKAAKKIQGFFQRHSELLGNLSKFDHLVALDQQGKDLMQVFFENHSSEIRSIARVGSNGRAIWAFPPNPNVEAADLADQEQVREMIQTHRPVLSDVLSSERGFDSVALHVPIFANDIFQGSLTEVISFDHLAKESLEDIKLGEDGYAWMISSKGVELYCPVPGHVGKPVFENCKDFPTILSMAREMVQGNQGTTTYIFNKVRGQTTESIKKHAVYLPIQLPGTFWSIVVATPESEVLESIQGFRDRWLLIITVLLIAVGLCSYYSGRAFILEREAAKRRQAEDALRENLRLSTKAEQLNEKMFEQERKYRVLFEAANDGIFLSDETGFVDCNQRGADMYGLSREEVLGRPPGELSPERQPDGRLSSEVAAEKALAVLNGEPQSFDWKYLRSDGLIFDAEISLNRVEMGGSFLVQALVRDITERKRAEEAIRTHIQFLENLELIDQAIKQETDVEKMLSNVIKTVFEIFTCDRAWLFYPCDPDAPSFRVPVEINRPEYAGAKALNVDVPMGPGMAEDLREALASEDPLPYTLGTEKPVNTLSAQQFGVQAQMFMAIYPKIGKPWVFGIHQCSYARIWSPQEQKLFKEIGRRIADGLSSVLSLREVKENEECFRATFEQAAVGMAHVALDGRYLRVNRKLCDIVGYSRDELLQKMPQDITHPDDLYADRECVRQILSGGISTYGMEKRYLRKDSSVVWINQTVSIVHHASGDPEYFISVIEDVTERKQAEEDRRRLEERLQRAEKMEALGTLAGGVAHDLNNVLGIIVGYSEMLVYDLQDSSPQKSQAKEILKGGQRAAAIVQDLLTLARRGVPSRKVLNLNSIIRDFQDSPEFAKLSSYHPKVRIETVLEADLLNISGSAVHLGKSLMNLVSNAAEAMPNGGVITIKTGNRYLDKAISGYDEVSEGDYVVLSVSDTGEGIPASDLKRIFEPFYTKKVMGRSGTGLGLAVVWGTVKDHYGYINVRSDEGKGTTFILYLPVTREEISPEQVSLSAYEYMGNGQSILVVDDVKEQRVLATMMLTKLNYRVMSVCSGEEAVEYLRHNTVDLVVLDMIMDRGMDGLDTYSRLLEINPHQRAVIVSGYSETERVGRAQALGAGSYVKKPYVLEKLGLAVKKEFDGTA